MNDYNPIKYLVRILYKKNGLGVTMDTSGNEIMQSIIASQIEETGISTMKELGLVEPENGSAFYEVLTGATANQISRREDLLNAARNLLIELDPLCNTTMRNIVVNMIDEIGDEIGIAS